MTGKNTVLKVDHLGVNLNNEEVLADVSFTLDRGKTIVIVGPNGAGKTVLFRALLGLLPHTGTVSFSRGVRIGYVPQRFTVEKDLPMTVGEFFALRTQDHEPVLKRLAEVDPFHGSEQIHALVHDADRFLKQRLSVLSGGQLQKVLIASALIDNPHILLFDEPTTGLDVGGEETVYGLLERLQKEHGLAALIISHDLNVVYRYADHVLCLNRRPICFGPPAEVLDADVIKELYGKHAGLYKHDHTATEHRTNR